MRLYGVLGWGVDTIMDQFRTWMANKTAELVFWVMRMVMDTDATSANLLDQPMYETVRQMQAWAFWFLPLFVILAILGAVKRMEPGQLGRLLLVDVPLAYMGAWVMRYVVFGISSMVDAMTAGMLRASPLAEAFGSLYEVTPDGLPIGSEAALDAATPMLIALLALVVAGVGAFTTWVMLIARMVVVAMAVVIGPFFVVARVWEPAREWFGKWVGLTIGLLFSKMALGLAWLAGWTILAGATDPSHKWSKLVGGAIVLAVGAFAPIKVMKLVPVLGTAAAAGGLGFGGGYMVARLAQSGVKAVAAGTGHGAAAMASSAAAVSPTKVCAQGWAAGTMGTQPAQASHPGDGGGQAAPTRSQGTAGGPGPTRQTAPRTGSDSAPVPPAAHNVPPLRPPEPPNVDGGGI